MLHLPSVCPHIAILRALHLGDLLCALPAVRALRAQYPEAHIAWIGLPHMRALIERYPDLVDEYINFPGWPGLPERTYEPGAVVEFLGGMQEREFDLVLQMQGDGTITNALVGLMGAAHTAGFYLPSAYRPDPAAYLPYPDDCHEILRHLRLVAHLGVEEGDTAIPFPIAAAEERAARELLGRVGRQARYVVFHVGARDLRRQWSPAKFGAVGQALAREGFAGIFTGTSAERPLVTAACRAMGAGAIDVCGETDLGTLAALVNGAAVVVANDTGISHVAAARRTPSVILYSISDPNRWAPLDRTRHRAMSAQASPEAVIEVVREQLLAVPERNIS